jgi:hypothetical protein
MELHQNRHLKSFHKKHDIKRPILSWGRSIQNKKTWIFLQKIYQTIGRNIEIKYWTYWSLEI